MVEKRVRDILILILSATISGFNDVIERFTASTHITDSCKRMYTNTLRNRPQSESSKGIKCSRGNSSDSRKHLKKNMFEVKG